MQIDEESEKLETSRELVKELEEEEEKKRVEDDAELNEESKQIPTTQGDED